MLSILQFAQVALFLPNAFAARLFASHFSERITA